MAALAIERSPADRCALAFLAARRAPTRQLARLWTAVPPDAADCLARGLSGREHRDAPVALPDILRPRVASDSAVADLVQRFLLPIEPTVEPVHLLESASLPTAIAGARLLAAPSIPWPDPSIADALPPGAIAPLVRSLANQPAASAAWWPALLRLTSERAAISPRRWANAWRSVRDAFPAASPEALLALRGAVLVVNASRELTGPAAIELHCENAEALDKRGGWPAETLSCAPADRRAVGSVAQANVLGASAASAARRAQALGELYDAAGGDPRVLEAIATAAATVPLPASRPIFVRLAAERDPGVLAATLEALSAHPAVARALPDATGRALIAAPFSLPEPVSVEARTHALEVATAIHVELPDAGQSRAARSAAAPDAGVEPMPFTPTATASLAPVTVRFETDAGTFGIEIEPRFAPAAAAVVLGAVRAGRYAGLTFHRVVPGFVAQGGDPRGDGYGGTDTITPTELTLQRFDRGAVGIPLAGLDTGGMQLFVVLADAPHLDGRYPWIGRVVDGMDVVDGILPGDHIRNATIVPSDGQSTSPLRTSP